MSALDRRHPLQQRYYRHIRNATAIAVAAHGLVFALAPAYVPRPLRMKADLLRLVEPSILDVPWVRSGPSGPSGPRGGASTVAPNRPSWTAASAVRTEPAEREETRVPSSGGGADGAAGSAVGGSGGGSGGTGITDEGPPVFYAYDNPPRVRKRFEPLYPPEARAQGLEGTVIVNANVDERGRVLRAWVAQANAAEVLISAALEAVYQFEFAPGRLGDAPVKCTVAIPFEFRLKKTLQDEGGD